MSSRSSGARRFGGVARIRRTPDNARRTTSDRPGAGRPAAVWNWLMLEHHRVNVAGLYRHSRAPPAPPTTTKGRYHPPDAVIAFLDNLCSCPPDYAAPQMQTPPDQSDLSPHAA